MKQSTRCAWMLVTFCVLLPNIQADTTMLTPTFTPVITPTFTPTPHCTPVGNGYHSPSSDLTCNGDTQRFPLNSQHPSESVCIWIWMSDFEPAFPQALHYRVGTGAWQTHDLQYECFDMMYRNHYWTYCDEPANAWFPGGDFGDQVDYYFEIQGFMGCTEYAYNSGFTISETEAQTDPYSFTYPENTSVPSSGPIGIGIMIAAMMGLLSSTRLSRRKCDWD